jgi:hypothetical protein
VQKSALTLMLLSLLVACSTTPAVRTEVRHLEPSPALLQMCDDPFLVETKTGRDLVTNSNARQSAFERCKVRLTCLIGWHIAAKKVAAEKLSTESLPTDCKIPK